MTEEAEVYHSGLEELRKEIAKLKKSNIQYCYCGREAKFLHPRCEKHKDKPEPKKKTKRTPFSGYSRYREDMGQFQAIEGR